MATGFSPRRRAAFSLVLAARWSVAAGQCHFEDSDGRCWEPEPRGVCGKPEHGASALIQHADDAELCTREPPYGFRPMCTGEGAAEALKMIRELRDPATCHYRTCALVGASGTLLGARLGSEIDKHDAVIRINFAPDGTQAAREVHGPHAHAPTWVADIGARTTWRVLTMEGYGYLRHYPRFWLKPPKGHGEHDDMSGIPQHPLLAIACHTPSKNMGRCRTERLRQVFAHPWSASYLINPVMMNQVRATYFTGVRNQKTLSTGMTAIAFAQQLCGQVHLYGFGNGSCGDACYHYYDCGPTAGTSGANQSRFLSDPRTSGGFHNFSAQAAVLQRMAQEGSIVPHWGRCDRNFGDPPADSLRTREEPMPLSRGVRQRRGRGAHRGGGHRGGGRGRGARTGRRRARAIDEGLG